MRVLRIGVIAVGTLALLGALGIGAWLGVESVLCDNRVFREEPSPDGKLRAVLFTRSCVFDRSPNFQLSVIEANSQLRDFETGNVFVAEKEFGFHWKDSRRLEVDGAGIYRFEETVYGFDGRPD